MRLVRHRMPSADRHQGATAARGSDAAEHDDELDDSVCRRKVRRRVAQRAAIGSLDSWYEQRPFGHVRPQDLDFEQYRAVKAQRPDGLAVGQGLRYFFLDTVASLVGMQQCRREKPYG